MSDDLATFLLARLDERAQMAQACANCGHSVHDHEAGHPYPGCVARYCDCPTLQRGVHLKPAHVLADVAAKRRIVEEYRAAEEAAPDPTRERP